jgi:hypothetical protein
VRPRALKGAAVVTQIDTQLRPCRGDSGTRTKAVDVPGRGGRSTRTCRCSTRQATSPSGASSARPTSPISSLPKSESRAVPHVHATKQPGRRSLYVGVGPRKFRCARITSMRRARATRLTIGSAIRSLAQLPILRPRTHVQAGQDASDMCASNSDVQATVGLKSPAPNTGKRSARWGGSQPTSATWPMASGSRS